MLNIEQFKARLGSTFQDAAVLEYHLSMKTLAVPKLDGSTSAKAVKGELWTAAHGWKEPINWSGVVDRSKAIVAIAIMDSDIKAMSGYRLGE